MTQIGGEIGQLQSLQTNFTRQTEAVRELTASVRNQLGNTWWKGPAADRFRSAWQGEFEPALRKLEGALQDAGTEVSRRREALIQAGS
jgi:uncharacterized protein YukE